MEYTIHEISEKFSLAPHTLRYYEKEGLLPPVRRLENGRRLYSETDAARIQMICCMRSSGMSIEAIKHYNELHLQGEDTLPERRGIIARQKAIVDDHIQEYLSLQALLQVKLDYYDSLIAENPRHQNRLT